MINYNLATTVTTTTLLNMPRIGLGTLGLLPSEASPVIVSEAGHGMCISFVFSSSSCLLTPDADDCSITCSFVGIFSSIILELNMK
jgi:hypothetical protein